MKTILFTDQFATKAARFCPDTHVKSQLDNATRLLCTTLHCRRVFSIEACIGSKPLPSRLLLRRLHDIRFREETAYDMSSYFTLPLPMYINSSWAKWTRSSAANFIWMLNYADELCAQWSTRWPQIGLDKRCSYRALVDKIYKMHLTMPHGFLPEVELIAPPQVVSPSDWSIIYPMTRFIHAQNTVEFATQTYQRYVNLCLKGSTWTPPSTKPIYVT